MKQDIAIEFVKRAEGLLLAFPFCLLPFKISFFYSFFLLSYLLGSNANHQDENIPYLVFLDRMTVTVSPTL